MADLSKFAHLFAEAAMQKASFDICDRLNEWPDELRVFFLASAQSLINAYRPRLSENDQKLFDHLVGHTENVIVSTIFDPRKSTRGGVDDG